MNVKAPSRVFEERILMGKCEEKTFAGEEKEANSVTIFMGSEE